MGADAADQFGQGLIGNLLLPRPEGLAGPRLRLLGPVGVVRRPPGKALDRAQLVEGLVESLALVHLAGADEQADVCPRKLFEFPGQFRQRFRHVRRGRALVAQEIAVLEPDDLPGAEERQGLQGLPEFGQRPEGFVFRGDARIYRFVVHPPHFRRPLLVDLPGALLDDKIILAADQLEGRGGLGSRRRHGPIRTRCRSR